MALCEKNKKIDLIGLFYDISPMDPTGIEPTF